MEWLNTILMFSISLILTLNLSLAVTFDVTDFGAKGDGNVDDSQAFLQAWAKTCASSSSATMVVPGGKTYMLFPLQFNGPCKGSSYIQVQIDGTLVGPKKISDWTGCMDNAWIEFVRVDGLQVFGKGTLDGQGSQWWKNSNNDDNDNDDTKNNSNPKKGKKKPPSPSPSPSLPSPSPPRTKGNMCSLPILGLRFASCKNLELRGLTHINPPARHIHINACTNVIISELTITAPENSPNTDGIAVSSSSNVNITNSVIGTGDDCIAITPGSSNIFIEGIQCGPGHGISVGSLGEGGSRDTVEGVHVVNCKFTRTTNGARIKTWPGGKGYARNIQFENIQLVDVKNSIVIDQNYCDGKHGCPTKPGAVEVSNVNYINVQGRSATNQAILLDCSNDIPCSNIVFDNVNITSSSKGGVFATCKNADVSIPNKVYPTISCTKNGI